jgi:hypothetical protein
MAEYALWVACQAGHFDILSDNVIGMVWKPRIHCPGAFYHVMLRGNGGQDIFFSSADRYLVELVRYFQCNTVRVGLAANPDTYQWSSHQT